MSYIAGLNLLLAVVSFIIKSALSETIRFVLSIMNALSFICCLLGPFLLVPLLLPNETFPLLDFFGCKLYHTATEISVISSESFLRGSKAFSMI